MKKAIFWGVLISVILISCGKASNNGAPLNHNGDNTGPWVGTYTGASNNSSNTVNRVVVSKVNDSVVEMQLQIGASGLYYTFATVQNAMLTTTTSATINENGLIYGHTDIYHFVGSSLLNGNNLTISGSGTSTTNASDVQLYYFSGNK